VPPTIPPAVATATQTIDLGEGVRLELVKLPAGEFVVGDPAGCDDEKPPTRVRIDQPFWMGRCEITNRQFRLLEAAHDSRLERAGFLHFDPGARGATMNGDDQPVVRVSWLEAMRFCRWLTQKTHRPFTLPSEAQWEYACRAGNSTSYSFGDSRRDLSQYAWYDGNSGRSTRPVGQKEANRWGLYDMLGNAREWCRDVGSYYPDPSKPNSEEPVPSHPERIVRGGSWASWPHHCRSACRGRAPEGCRINDMGFRVVVLLDKAEPAQAAASH
jgi:formylglycine-generating enzyme required for sulfatase activity